MLTSHLKGQKTVGRARASLILANNFLPLNEALGIFVGMRLNETFEYYHI